MKIAVISDVHGNWDALFEVLKKLNEVQYDKLVCLGDIIGYGAEPARCWQALSSRCEFICMGNHEAAVLGLLPLEWFNPYAKAAVLWTSGKLSSLQKAEMKEKLSTKPVKIENFIFTHGSLRDPVSEYIDAFTAAPNLSKLGENHILVVGHTHIPFYYGKEKYFYLNEGETPLNPPCIVNPGAVGQPRDGDPRAAFGVIDTESPSITVYRLEYNIESAARKIIMAGLPEILAQRLFHGR